MKLHVLRDGSVKCKKAYGHAIYMALRLKGIHEGPMRSVGLVVGAIRDSQDRCPWNLGRTGGKVDEDLENPRIVDSGPIVVLANMLADYGRIE